MSKIERLKERARQYEIVLEYPFNAPTVKRDYQALLDEVQREIDRMTDEQSIRIGSIIDILDDGVKRRAEVIGYVLGKPTKIRVEYQNSGVIELRDDLTNDKIELVIY